MNLDEKYEDWMNNQAVLSINIVSESDMNIVGKITSIGSDFIQVSGRHGRVIIPKDKIGYVRIQNNSEE